MSPTEVRAVQVVTSLFVLLDASRAAAAWPPNATPGGRYEVHASEATMTIADLVLPDDFTLTIDPAIQHVKWTVERLSFGRGVTIDLSAPPGAAPSGATPPPMGGQARHGKAGAPGNPGGPGAPGRSARALALRVRSLVTSSTGSLWIRTDGGTGGSGGAGGKGQTGGGSTCGGGSEGPRTHAGDGGFGGWGGPGGPGGHSSFVVVRMDTLPVGFEERAQSCASPCGASTRPPTATQNNGKIVIWGAPGCGGAGGVGGPGGAGDMSVPRRHCRDFPFGNVFVHGSSDGPTGPSGPRGVDGFCGVGDGGSVIEGPPRAIVQGTPPNASPRDRCIAGESGACAAYAQDILVSCTSAPDPAARDLCTSRSSRWANRGSVLQRAVTACDDPSGDLFDCAMSRALLKGPASPAACDAAVGSIRTF